MSLEFIVPTSVGVISLIYLIIKLNGDTIHWLGKKAVSSVEINELDSNSDIKKEFNAINMKLDDQDQVLKSLRNYAQDNRAFQLRTEIRFTIEHDLGKNEVRRLYEIYKSIPTNKSARNGHISAEIKEYVERVNKTQYHGN